MNHQQIACLIDFHSKKRIESLDRTDGFCRLFGSLASQRRQVEATSVGLTTSDCDGMRRRGFLTARAGCKGPLRSWKLGGPPQAAHLIY